MPARPALTTGAGMAPVLPLALTAGSSSTGTPPAPRPTQDWSGLWLRNAAAGLCVLAAAAAAVSFTAQYRMAEPPATCPRSRCPQRARRAYSMPDMRLLHLTTRRSASDANG
jgi:hypothetical protein